MPKFDTITICNTEPTDPKRKIVFCNTDPKDPERKIVFCPDKDPDNPCAPTEPLQVNGPTTLVAGSSYTAKGGTEPYTWYVPSEADDYTLVGNILTVNTVEEPCATKGAGIKVIDSCGFSASQGITIERTTAALSLSGTETPVNGSTYTASGGFAPYEYSISCGSISSGGVVSGVNSGEGCCGSGWVRVTDACGDTAEITIRFVDGQWSVYFSYNSSSCTIIFDLDCNTPAASVYDVNEGQYRYREVATYNNTGACSPEYTGEVKSGLPETVECFGTTYHRAIIQVEHFIWECT